MVNRWLYCVGITLTGVNCDGGMVNSGCVVTPPESLYNLSERQSSDSKTQSESKLSDLRDHNSLSSQQDVTIDPHDPLSALSDSDMSRLSSRCSSRTVSLSETEAPSSNRTHTTQSGPTSSLSTSDVADASQYLHEFYVQREGGLPGTSVLSKEGSVNRLAYSADNSPLHRLSSRQRDTTLTFNQVNNESVQTLSDI